MSKVRNLLTEKLLCPMEQSMKQNKVNNVNSAFIFLINLLIGQGSCHGGPGVSGGQGGKGGQGGPLVHWSRGVGVVQVVRAVRG